MKRFSQEIRNNVLALYAHHKSALAVEQMTGVDRTTIGRWLKKENLLINKRGPNKICPTCSKEFYIYPSEAKKNDRIYCSVSCRNKSWKDLGRFAGEQNPRWQGGVKQHKLTSYRVSAKKRSLDFKLKLSDFMEMWQKPCYYCGSIIETVGVDRVDNNKGYTLDNVVPCCSKCNYMKNSNTEKEFLEHVEKIHDFNFSKLKKENAV